MPLGSFGAVARQAEKLLSWSNACGAYLGRLATKFHERVRREDAAQHSLRRWRIMPPGTTVELNEPY